MRFAKAAESVGSPHIEKGVMLWVSKSKGRTDKRQIYYTTVIDIKGKTRDRYIIRQLYDSYCIER
jgi:hypothetical protein